MMIFKWAGLHLMVYDSTYDNNSLIISNELLCMHGVVISICIGSVWIIEKCIDSYI
jgi:hypothetical protein